MAFPRSLSHFAPIQYDTPPAPAAFSQGVGVVGAHKNAKIPPLPKSRENTAFREVGFRALSPSAGHRVREKSLLRRPAESSTLRGGCALRGYHSLHFSNKNCARVWMPILLRLRIGNRLMVEMFRCVHKSCAQKTNATGLLQVQCRAWQRDIIRHGDTGLFRGVHRPVTGAFLAGSVTSAQQQQTREHARARPLGLVLSR